MCAQDAMNVPVFTNSDESFAAEDLLNAYRSGDGAQIKKLITPNRCEDMQDDWCSQSRGIMRSLSFLWCSCKWSASLEGCESMLRCPSAAYMFLCNDAKAIFDAVFT